MSTQPDALRLADELEDEHYPWPRFPAAAELRRLYQLAMDQQGEIYALKMARSMEQKTAALKRDALLEALKEAVDFLEHSTEFRLGHPGFERVQARARAAINKAEEQTQEQDEPVQEPVAWLTPRNVDSYPRPDLGYETSSKTDYGAFPVYTAPPQRKPEPVQAQLTAEHISSPECWCQPELNYVEPVTGAKVWVHKEIQ